MCTGKQIILWQELITFFISSRDRSPILVWPVLSLSSIKFWWRKTQRINGGHRKCHIIAGCIYFFTTSMNSGFVCYARLNQSLWRWIMNLFLFKPFWDCVYGMMLMIYSAETATAYKYVKARATPHLNDRRRQSGSTRLNLSLQSFF